MSSHPINVTSVRRALDENYILLLTTNSIEKDSIARLLGDSVPAQISTDHSGCRLGRICGRFVLHVNGTSGAQSDRSIGRITRRLFSDPFVAKPSIVLVVGFAWGNPARVSPGDVVIANEVWAINHVRHVKGTVTYRPEQRRSTVSDLADFAETLSRTTVDGFKTPVLTGPLASGESYYADTKARDALLANLSFVLGGEMEAYDLVPDLNSVPWLLIKGISDDAADTTDGSAQSNAAARAAALLVPLLNELTRRTEIAAHREDSSSASLIDALIGQSIHMARPDDTKRSLNDHLNEVFGPRIAHRLGRYASDRDPNGMLARLLTDLLLELTQNAMRHGNASHVTINFNETSLSLRDNGRPYDIETLTGDRGGHRAWRRFQAAFVNDGLIAVTHKSQPGSGNTYKFKLTHLSQELRLARERCPMTIVRGTVGMPDAGVQRLSYDPDCSNLYFDATEIYMTSRRLELLREIDAILQTGKGVFIACHDQEDKLFYEQELAHYSGSRLRVFVAGRA